MRIAHFSDPHAGGPAEDFLAYLDKRMIGVFNYKYRRRFRHDLTRLERAVDYILSAQVDAVVCTGDLTSSGQPGEFDKIRPYLQRLVEAKIPILYSPGNHDCYVKRHKCVTAVEQMTKFLAQGSYSLPEMPLLRGVKECDFILLNTSHPSNLLCSWGFVTAEDEKKVLEICASPKMRPRILITHYPMYEAHPILRLRHRLFGQRKIVELLHDGAIDLALCGHVHKPFARLDEEGRGESCAGSVSSHGVFSIIDYRIDDNKFEFQQIKV
ncbi:MAG: metallophosphoesterase [Victivallaceae bacterium]